MPDHSLNTIAAEAGIYKTSGECTHILAWVIDHPVHFKCTLIVSCNMGHLGYMYALMPMLLLLYRCVVASIALFKSYLLCIIIFGRRTIYAYDCLRIVGTSYVHVLWKDRISMYQYDQFVHMLCFAVFWMCTSSFIVKVTCI